jgi:serine/threonine protein kinase/Tol biopolymer transport system component
MPFANGSRLGPYDILALIGAGGMGEVYKARDPRLNRMVALKVLPQGVVGGSDQRKRLLREARAASALNHPNIITVHEIGSYEGIDFIAMEYVSGKSLEQLMKRTRLPLDQALDYAIQIADALAAAHAAGVVHRDLKPGNIMVTEEGRVKVLDFGLAKLTERTPDSDFGQTQTMSIGASDLTGPGVIVGTLAYMSPEQLKGQKSDFRSDIFSFAAVLYETIAGRPAFRSTTQMETVAAVLQGDPPATSEIVPGVPPQLEKILTRCLRKDPARRLQHMGDVGSLLEDVREDLRFGRPALEPGGTTTPGRRRHAYPWLAAVGALCVMVGAVAFWRVGASSSLERGPILKRLTFDNGLTTTPAMSADGRLLAFASDRAGHGNLDIWVRQLAGGEALQVTRDPADEYEPTFSPDGTRIAFRSDQEGGGIYVTSALGGEEPRMIAPEGRTPRFSPDGNWIAYWVGEWQGPARPMRSRAFVMTAYGTERRELAAELAAAYDPVWSPDGKHLLFAGSSTPNVGVAPDWFVVPADGGLATPTGAADVFRRMQLSDPSPAVWTDKNQLVFSAKLADSTNVWQVPLQQGKWRITEPARRLTFGAGSERNASLVSGSGPARLVFSVLKDNIDLWSLPLDANRAKPAGELQRLTRDEADDKTPSTSADGKLAVFSSNRTGAYSIYRKDLTSGKETSLSRGVRPLISRDGSNVVYAAEDGSKQYLLKIGPGGLGKPPVLLKLTDGFGSTYSWSPGGERVFYAVRTGDRWGVDVQDFRSGRNYSLFRHARYDMFLAQPSPDDRWLVFLVNTDNTRSRVHVAPFREAAMIRPDDWFALTNSETWEDKPNWSPDGTAIYYTSDRDGFRCIWAQRVDAETKRPTGPEIPVYHSHSTRLSLRNLSGTRFAVAVARDKLVFNIAEITGNLWLAQLPEH